MTEGTLPKAGALLHLRALEKGEPVAPPLVQASMYHLPGSPEAAATYGRAENPTWEIAEAALAHLEDAPVVLFPSGMAAISAAFFATLKAGARVLMPADGYYATRVLASDFLERFGVSVDLRSTVDYEAGGFAGFDVVFLETPSNPGLELIDIRKVAAAVRAAGGLTIADNTTMTPYGQRPLDLGVDVVVASDTKAPGGHSDLLMGHVACRDPEVFGRIASWRKFSGAIPGPMEAWLLHRGLETLELRFDRMCRTAGALAERLAAHPKVESVRYPGLQSDPSYPLAKSQMSRFGFLVQVTFASDEAAESFIDGCALLQPATSFGGVHSSAERRLRWGDNVASGAVRLSVGCEPLEELWSAMEMALDALEGP
ncbi:MAG: cystathionine gamma-lyase [Pseudomonadota bacterium]